MYVLFASKFQLFYINRLKTKSYIFGQIQTNLVCINHYSPLQTSQV